MAIAIVSTSSEVIHKHLHT